MSLYELQRKSLKKTFERYQCNFRHLICDDTTYPVVKSLFKEDILNYVYTFYKIDDKERSKNQEKAIYILDPIAPYSIDCLLADYSHGLRYKDAIVCFLPGMNAQCFAHLRANKYLMESVNGSFETIEYLSLRPLENRVFVTGNSCSIPGYYNFAHLGRDLVQYQMDRAVDAMMSMCILTNEYPVVRFYNSPLSKQLATTFQNKIDEYYRKHSELTPVNNRTIFLVTERAMDLFGPFCHYKYYRSQIFDLMDDHIRKIRGDYTFVYDYEAKTGQGMEKKHIVFDSDDPVFTQLKDVKIEDYTQKIIQMLKDLKHEDDKYSNLKYTSDLSHAAISQSDHMFKKQLVTGHFELINRISSAFQAECILDAIVFENKCAANLGSDRHLHEPVTDELVGLLSNQNIFMGNKIRLLIVYAIYRGGLIESDFIKLLKFGMPDKVDSILKLIHNLQKLGLKIIKPSLGGKTEHIQTYFDVKNTTELTDRFVPTFSNLVLRLAQNDLPELYHTCVIDNGYIDEEEDNILEDEKTFPYVKGAPMANLNDSFRNVHLGGTGGSKSRVSVNTVRSQPKWKSMKPSDKTLTRQKLMIFCAGGLTESELGTMISLEPKINKNIFIGSDEIYSTWDMLGDIRLIDDDRKNFRFALDAKFSPRKVPDFLSEVTGGSSKSLIPDNGSKTNGQGVHQQPHDHHHHLHHLHHHSDVNDDTRSRVKSGSNDKAAHNRKRDKLFGKLKRFQ
ncbi:DEBR0S2_17128g1_1 [Brettanomyces bruxellensis]|uniref:DEBR0S2_17128g1_1 n=1 Tax=Dekkera bruxellensis TaxID=5007 RepID=A0A7D9GZA1_DEKBR|nr:DEBR0S2_17128g1_1 [Brettanomyces bruxellensis]